MRSRWRREAECECRRSFRPQRQRRTAKPNFLASRGMGASPGEESSKAEQLRQGIRGVAVIRPDRHQPRPARFEAEGRTGESTGGKGREAGPGLTVQSAPWPGSTNRGTAHEMPATAGHGAGPGTPGQPPRAARTSPLSQDPAPLPGINHCRKVSGPTTPTGAPAPQANANPDPCAPPGGAPPGAPDHAIAGEQHAAQRPTKEHSRKRPAGRAACARACGPAAALTPGRASVRRGNQRRATSGGAVRRCQCALR
jgi:hypothetical protein